MITMLHSLLRQRLRLLVVRQISGDRCLLPRAFWIECQIFAIVLSNLERTCLFWNWGDLLASWPIFMYSYETYPMLKLKLNWYERTPGGLFPWLSINVKPNWMIFRKSTFNFRHWYWYSAGVLNSPKGRTTMPGNSVS